MSSVSSTTPSTNKSCFIATLPIKHPELNGALLGRNGSEIKKLKESSEYQFRIKLYNENNMENKKLFDCTHIRVESSSEEGLRDAVKILKERINKLKENRMMREKEKEKEISSILKLDVNHKPMFIGKNGRNIKSLEDNNQCRINISNEQDEEGFFDIKITCQNEENLTDATNNIREHIGKLPVFFVMNVDGKEVSKIIGVKGSNIKEMLNNLPSNTYISYKKQLNGFQIIADNQSVVDSVVEMINDRIYLKEKTLITEDLFWDSDNE